MSKAEDVLAPSGDGTENTTVVTYTLDTTARNGEIPAYLYGEFIRVTPYGANVWWYISTSADATVDRTIVPVDSDPQQDPEQGSRLDNGITVERLCPYRANGQKLYLVWQGDAAGEVLQVEKGSGRPQVVAVTS
jgi:hypothetical protein